MDMLTLHTKKGVKYMKQIKRRMPTVQSKYQNPFENIESEKELWKKFSEEDLQGMMMMYHYIHPKDEPIIEGKEKGINILNQLRATVRIKMHPIEYLYLLDPFDEVATAIDLRKSLGKRLRGALYVFDYFLASDGISTEAPSSTTTPSNSTLSDYANLPNLPLSLDNSNFLIYWAEQPVFVIATGQT